MRRTALSIFITLSICYVKSEIDVHLCTYHSYRTSWVNAVEECRKENSELLCYKSGNEMQKVISAFSHLFPSKNDVKLWILNRNCTGDERMAECLSLRIEKKAERVWHFFQKMCSNFLTFICCPPDGGIGTVSLPNTPSFTSPTTHTIFIPTTHTIFIPTTEVTSTVEFVTTISETSVEKSESTTSISKTTEAPQPSCKSLIMKGIKWPATVAGKTVRKPCPGNSIGSASWTCSLGGVWSKEGPNLSSCRSTVILNIKENFNNSSANETISALDDVFKKGKDMYANDLFDSVELLTLLPDKLFEESLSLVKQQRWHHIEKSVSKTVSVFDNMMILDSWSEVSENKKPKIGSDIVTAVDKFGMLLADTMDATSKEYSIMKENIAIQTVQKVYGQEVRLPENDTYFKHGSKGHIILSQGYDQKLNSQERVSVIYVYYENMRHILINKEGKGILNSPVISATVSQNRKQLHVASHVRIFVEHTVKDSNDTTCVFWNVDMNMWDTTGCYREYCNSSHSICICDHLTNFAVLTDYQGLISNKGSLPLFFITITGCSISIVSLMLCVLVFTCYRYSRHNMWNLRYTIHRNLCLTLLIANVILVFGLDKTDNQVACGIIAGLLHYFFLSAFTWMLLEGIHIYLLLVVVFALRRTHWEKYYVVGYGFPMAVVAITAGLRPYNYGTFDSCWLSVKQGTVWGFTGPVACILIINSAALMLAQWKASKIKSKDNNLLLIKRWLRITLILFPILGITWVFGFLYIGKHYEIAAYIFAILNSLQGFCIFIGHCLLDQKVRVMITSSLKRKKATVETDSTGTQKRLKKIRNGYFQQDQQMNVENEVKSDSSDSSSPFFDWSALKNRWDSWQKPWTFCVTWHPTNKSQSSTSNEDQKELPKAVVLQWNVLPDIEND